METCPQCAAPFDAKAHRAYSPFSVLFLRLVSADSMVNPSTVRCPQCKHDFLSDQITYWGAKPLHFYIALAVLVNVCTAAALVYFSK